MSGIPQLAKPSSKPKDPNDRLRRPLEIVVWIAIVAIPIAALQAPRLAAGLIALAMFAIGTVTAYNCGRRSGVALQRQACREGRRG